jgi:hypothetical protein
MIDRREILEGRTVNERVYIHDGTGFFVPTLPHTARRNARGWYLAATREK